MATLEQLTSLLEVYRKMYRESKSVFVREQAKRLGLKVKEDIAKLPQPSPDTTAQFAEKLFGGKNE